MHLIIESLQIFYGISAPGKALEQIHRYELYKGTTIQKEMQTHWFQEIVPGAK
ncbi:MAG: hypothetical protein IPN08_19630 [Bacteroidales bacterium]|nr:hypothetical protein [Bacteroidales bacterium]